MFDLRRPATTAQQWRSDPRWSQVPALDADRLLGGRTRLVVVAAHPDDETLGAASLLRAAHERGLTVDVVLVTSGEHSHPDSPTTTPADLVVRRERESCAALGLLAPEATLHTWGVEDGTVSDHQAAVTRRLVELVGDGRSTLVCAPWREDDHPDHEATGRAAARASLRTGAGFLEYPVWMWHWADPDQAPWSDLRLLATSPEQSRLKRAALAEHVSQVSPLSDRPGDEVLLDAGFLAHFTGDGEAFLLQPAQDTDLDELHQELADPWGVDHRWYERRKHTLAVACLPRERYRHALEVGCSTGALTRRLAERSDAVTAVDASPAAVRAATERLSGTPRVEVSRLLVPEQWPAGRYDLVVVSEVAYFLSPPALDELAVRVRESLDEDGVVVLCHWRHRIDGWALDGEEAHDRLREALSLPEIVGHVERDFVLTVLGPATQAPEPSR